MADVKNPNVFRLNRGLVAIKEPHEALRSSSRKKGMTDGWLVWKNKFPFAEWDNNTTLQMLIEVEYTPTPSMIGKGDGTTLMRKNLVIVRAGKASLHRGWLSQPYISRSFDVVVSYYDSVAYERHEPQEGVMAVLFQGGKWDGIYKTLERISDTLDQYDYVWLPDDDIETEGHIIDKMFLMMKLHSLKVGQPSLTLDSYFTHFIFIQCPGLQIRKTNFIEIMVPCLSSDVLRAVSPNFKNTLSGFGLDYIWCRIPESGQRNAGIIDAVAVKHTRPVGQVLMTKMKTIGIDPKQEEADLASAYGLDRWVTPLAYMAITNFNTVFEGKFVTGVLMAAMYTRVYLQRSKMARHYDFGRIVQLLRRQLTRRLDLSELRQSNPRVSPDT